MNPYEVLGVAPGATQDEIKKAYRKKARENHPDLHPNDPQAAERMNRINEAYELLMDPEKYRAYQAREAARRAGAGAGGGTGMGGYGGYGGGGPRGSAGFGYGPDGPYTWTSVYDFNWDDIFSGAYVTEEVPQPEPSAVDSQQVKVAVTYINSGSYRGALDVLNAIPSVQRDARWYYLCAFANKGVGNEMLALDQMRKAVTMDPNNEIYKHAFAIMQRSGKTYTATTQSRGFNTSFMSRPASWCCGCLALNACLNPALCIACL